MPRSRSRPPNEARLLAEAFGHRGETLAALYLRAKLYRIVARRFKTPVGEIDLVAMRGRELVFVEVKARRGAETEAEALGAVNRARIVRAAQYFVARHARLAANPMRFDVIFLGGARWPRHLVNAFDASP